MRHGHPPVPVMFITTRDGFAYDMLVKEEKVTAGGRTFTKKSKRDCLLPRNSVLLRAGEVP